LNEIVKRDPKKADEKPLLYDPQRFRGVSLSPETTKMLADQARLGEIKHNTTRLVETMKLEAAKRLDTNPALDETEKAKLLKKFEQESALPFDRLPRKEVNAGELNRRLLRDAYPRELAFNDKYFSVTDSCAAFLASVGYFCFFLGRVSGAAWLRKVSAHKMLGLYSVINAALCLLVFLKLGWLSVACLFLSYFFMSITFPTIFALGIFGLGARAKRASSYIVMAIVGGALLPKLMGSVADHYDMSRGFIVPLVCFVFVALYGYGWPKLSRAESLHGVGASGGH
jgi:hypothetical protein